MRVVRLDSNFYAISCVGYSIALRNAAKMSPGMFWDSERRIWYGRQDAVDLCCAILSNGGITVEAAPSDYVYERWRDMHFSPKLRNYQLVGARHLIEEKRAILADDMGLGKTLTALSAAFASGSNRILIVCPNRAKDVWKRELKKSFNEEAFYPQGRGGRNEPAGKLSSSARVWVINYEILSAWQEILIRESFDDVIFDECHNLMNEKSKRTQAARAVSKDATYVWGLSGTLLPNRVSDLYAIVETIRPKTFGTFFNFAFRYCGAIQGEHPSRAVPGAKEKHWNFDGSSNEDELRQRLAYFALRRTKSDVKLELPPKTRMSLFVDVKGARPPSVAASLSKSEMRRQLDVAATGKLGDVVDAARAAVLEGNRVVIFTYRKVVAESLTASLTAAGVFAQYFHGDVPQARRLSYLTSPPDVLVATIDSAGDAIDLSFASVCIFAELSYEPFKLLQAEARLHRFGQENPVLIQYFLARGTVDELVAKAVIDKLDTFGAVGFTPDGEALQPALQENESDMMQRLYDAMLSFEETSPLLLDENVSED